jgi:Zn-finger nucleic acid-binding protein
MNRDYPSFKCPRCNMVSYNRHDIEEGYCGNCHEWTRDEGLLGSEVDKVSKDRFVEPDEGERIREGDLPYDDESSEEEV